MKRSDNIKRLKALGKELSAKPKVAGNGNRRAPERKPEPVEEPKAEELASEQED